MESNTSKADSCCGSCDNHPQSHDQDHSHDHDHSHGSYWRIIISVILLVTASGLSSMNLLSGYYKPVLFALAYLPVGWPVLLMAWKAAIKGDLFNEFSLMGMATIGAFSIGEYAEGVSVMLFYTIGELFQDLAVNRARKSITDLLSLERDSARVWRGDSFRTVNAKDVLVGDKIQLLAGEKLSLDALLISDEATFNMSSITGESIPVTLAKGAFVPSGAIQIDKVVELSVKNTYYNSTATRMLKMVQEAAGRKAPTELFIRKFSRFYTPAVALAALAIIFVPSFFLSNYVFRDWLYRALVFLVISCPCALVISIPLSYFGGIGAASRKGIMFKGGNYVDALAQVDFIAFDKTGTLTNGKPTVTSYGTEIEESKFFQIAYALEHLSNHPIAKAVSSYCQQKGFSGSIALSDIHEYTGRGMSAMHQGDEVVLGNTRLINEKKIIYPDNLQETTGILIILAINGTYAGYFLLEDTLKENARLTIHQLSKMGIKKTAILSGDNRWVAESVASQLGIKKVFTGLMPHEKVHKMNELKQQTSGKVAYVGDGINDAPTLALSDVGIAMGGIGSALAVETADVVIQNDDLMSVLRAIKVAKATVLVARQNIVLALAVKLLVLGLGAMGMASMWAAVFADVGVALLAILNASSIQYRDLE